MGELEASRVRWGVIYDGSGAVIAISPARRTPESFQMGFTDEQMAFAARLQFTDEAGGQVGTALDISQTLAHTRASPACRGFRLLPDPLTRAEFRRRT